MVNGIVLPIKKVFALVDSKISVEIKDEGRKLQGRLVAVDEYLNIHMDETIEFVDNQRGRSLRYGRDPGEQYPHHCAGYLGLR